jgi:hypothetical protein
MACAEFFQAIPHRTVLTLCSSSQTVSSCAVTLIITMREELFAHLTFICMLTNFLPFKDVKRELRRGTATVEPATVEWHSILPFHLNQQLCVATYTPDRACSYIP